MKQANYILRASSVSFETAQETKLPAIKAICSLSIQLGTIHEIFQTTVTKLGFEIIEEEEGYATAVYRRTCSLKKLLSCCFKVNDEDSITAVKLVIGLNESKCIRQIGLKGLYGVIQYYRDNIWTE